VAQFMPGDRVVVVGAGPAGLTAAYQLAKLGISRVTVLEADDIVGGISRTAQYKGFRFDIGGHRFFTKVAAVEALWHEILGSEFISVPRLSRIHYNGRFFDYPLKARNALQGLGPFNALMIVLSYLKWHYRPHPVEENFEQWVTNRFGRRLYETFFKTYTEKVWGVPCTEIRAEWAAQRIQGLSLARAILSAASINRRSTNIKTLINEFQYPRLGPGQMWETCRDRIVERGQQVLLRHYVNRVEHCRGRLTAVHAQSPEGAKVFEAEHVISTMPVRSLVRALSPEAPPAVREAAEGLRYRDFVVVALMLRRHRDVCVRSASGGNQRSGRRATRPCRRDRQ
jgi:protoporphyrinogen oxidase